MEISEYKKLKNKIMSESTWEYILDNYDYVYIDNCYKLLPEKEISKLQGGFKMLGSEVINQDDKFTPIENWKTFKTLITELSEKEVKEDLKWREKL